jgi:hypothetical protein
MAEAASAMQHDQDDRMQKVSAAKLYGGRYGAELLQDCGQIHGGIGVTIDHDLHLFLRRVTTSLPVQIASAQQIAGSVGAMVLVQAGSTLIYGVNPRQIAFAAVGAPTFAPTRRPAPLSLVRLLLASLCDVPIGGSVVIPAGRLLVL